MSPAPAKKPLHAQHSHHTHHAQVHVRHAPTIRQAAPNIMDYAPNNADKTDSRGFLGAQEDRKNEEEKRRMAHRMRLEIRRRALLEAIRTGKIKLPARK
jgi:hypothetical protein